MAKSNKSFKVGRGSLKATRPTANLLNRYTGVASSKKELREIQSAADRRLK